MKNFENLLYNEGNIYSLWEDIFLTSIGPIRAEIRRDLFNPISWPEEQEDYKFVW